MKKFMPMVVLLLLISAPVSHALSGSFLDSKPPESTPPLLRAPAPMQTSCTVGWNAYDDYVTTAKNTPITFSPLANDDDTFQQNFAGISSGPSHGTAVQVGLDSVEYTPAPGYTGSDSFTYRHVGCVQCAGEWWSSWCAEESMDSATVYITVTN